MFDSFSLKNVLYPAEKVVETLVDSLKIDKESVDIKALVASMNEKEECTMQNPKMRLDAYNGHLKRIPLSIQSFTVNSLQLIFPKTYLKSVSTLRLNGIQLDLLFNQKEPISEEDAQPSKSSSSSGALMKVINMFIRNIKVEVTDLHVRVFIEKNIEYCLLIKHIGFDSNEKGIIDEKEKMKMIFLQNKLFTLRRVLFKENNCENDKLFFNSDEKDLAGQVGVYINKDTLFINHNDIVIDFNHDLANKELKISNSLSPFYFECVVTKRQIEKMVKGLSVLNRLFSYLVNTSDKSKVDGISMEKTRETVTPTPTVTLTPQEIKKPLDLFGFPMRKITCDLTMSCSYFALIDNLQESKAKIWMIYENQFKSYYDLKETSPTQNELLQKHLFYHNENFLFLFIDSTKCSFKLDTLEKETESQCLIRSIDLKFIQPNQVKNKKDILIIKNTEANEIDKLFNDNFFKHFFSVIKYGAYTYQVTHIDKIDIKQNGRSVGCAVNQILIDVNTIIVSHLISLYHVNQLIEINFEEGNRVRDIDKRLPFVIEVSVAKVNLRLMTHKKNLKLYQKFYEVFYRQAIDPKEKVYYNETFQQHLSVTVCGVSMKHSALSSSVTYAKLLCCYANGNLIYPLLFQTNSIDSVINVNETERVDDTGKKVNEMNLSSQVDQMLLFYNPLLSHKVISYMELLKYSLQVLASFVDTSKSKAKQNCHPQSALEVSLDCQVKNIQLICVSSIILPKQKKDVIKLIEDNEKLFKLLFNPMIKVKIRGTNLKGSINGTSHRYETSVIDIKLMVRKSENRFGKENASYQLVLEDKSEEDNFEFITYNPSATRECIHATIEFELGETLHPLIEGSLNDDLASFILSKKRSSSRISPIKGYLELNDFAISPLPLNLYDIIFSLDQIKQESFNSNTLITKSLNYSSEIIEIASYEKFEPFKAASQTKEESNSPARISYDITLEIQNLLIDLFSDTNHHYHRFKEDMNSSRDKMRLITQMTLLNLHLLNSTTEDTKALPVITMKISKLNSIFMKNLDILAESSMPLNGRTDTIEAEGSFWRSIGFAEIFSCTDIAITSTTVDNRISIHSIYILLCFDSLKFLIKFIKKVGKDMKKIQSMFDYIIEEDYESVITDINQLPENSNSYLEYRSINQIQSEKNNAKSLKYDFIDSKKKQRDMKGVNESSATPLKLKSGKVVKVSGLVYSVKISFFQGEDFNFQGRYSSDQSVKALSVTEVVNNDNGNDPHRIALAHEQLQSPQTMSIIDNNNNSTPLPQLKDCIKAPKANKHQSCIENINKRDFDNYITISLIRTEAKCAYYDHSNLILSTYFAIHNLLIEDNLSNTKYSKLLSRYDFEDTDNMFLATKADILSNTNGQNDIRAIIDLVPISIYLDQFTFKFILDFFYYNQQEIASQAEPKEMDEGYQGEITEQIFETQTVSQIHPIQYRHSSRFNRSIHGYSLTKFIINSFFINFNYFPRKFNFSSTDEEANLELINLVSIEDLNVVLKEVKITSVMPLEKLSDYLVDYWKNDIKDNQILRSFLKAIPIMRNFNNVFSGFVSIATIPYRSLENDKPIEESLVEGVRCFVSSASSEVLKFGESVTGFFKRIVRIPETNDNGFRQLIYKINGYTQRRDQYYLKAQQ